MIKKITRKLIRASKKLTLGILILSMYTSAGLGVLDYVKSVQNCADENKVLRNHVFKFDLNTMAGKMKVFLPEQVKLISVAIDGSSEINAYAQYDGQNYAVVFYKGIIDAAENPDQVAMILGHEIAHHMLGHTGGIEFNRPIALVDNWSSSQAHELMADTMGGLLAKRAGYNPCEGIRFWALLAKGTRMPTVAGSSHPAPIERAENLNKVFDCKKDVINEFEKVRLGNKL